MAEAPKPKRASKFDEVTAANGVLAIVKRNEALAAEVAILKEALREKQLVVDRHAAVEQGLRDSRDGLTKRVDELRHDLNLTRETVVRQGARLQAIARQAEKVKAWAHKHAHGNNTVIHAVDAVLFAEGYGEVHPLARWNYPGLELVK